MCPAHKRARASAPPPHTHTRTHAQKKTHTHSTDLCVSFCLHRAVLVHRVGLHEYNLSCSMRNIEKRNFHVWRMIVRGNCRLIYRKMFVRKDKKEI
jgi:hypothetical protein